MIRSEKDKQVDFLKTSLTTGEISIFAGFKGLNVAQFTTLRKELRGAGGTTKVFKNTLATIAVAAGLKDSTDSDLKAVQELFAGPNMIVVGKADPAKLAKCISNFAKANKALEIKGAWFEGAFINMKGVQELASLPSYEELMAKLLNLINAPATQLLRLIQAPGTQTVRLLDAHRAELAKKAA